MRAAIGAAQAPGRVRVSCGDEWSGRVNNAIIVIATIYRLLKYVAGTVMSTLVNSLTKTHHEVTTTITLII